VENNRRSKKLYRVVQYKWKRYYLKAGPTELAYTSPNVAVEGMAP